MKINLADHLTWVCLFCLAVSLGLRASAQPADAPLPNGVVVDGAVYAFAQTNNILYFGGQFTAVGLNLGGGAPVSLTDGQIQSGFPVLNGTVRQAISDGNGGWYVAGSFSQAGNLPRNNVVHIRSDLSIDPVWQPNVSGGIINAIVLAGSNLYMGGTFTNVNGQSRMRLAAVDVSTGSLASWNPSANAAVMALAAYNGAIYIGGSFGTLGGASLAYLGAVDATSGAPLAWNPGVSGGFGAADDVLTLMVSGTRLFVGGYFTILSGQSRSRLGSFDLTTGIVDLWDPSAGSLTIVQPTIFALAADGNTIYAGGTFTLMGASNAVNLAAIDASSGLASAWNPQADLLASSGFPTGLISALAVYNGQLYVGGSLGHIGGQARSYAAALDLVTANATAWDPRPNLTVATLAGSGTGIFVGGSFSSLGTQPRNNVAAYDLAASQLAAWDPNVQGPGGYNTPVNAVLVAGNQVFIGGYFTNVGGSPVLNLAAVDPVTGVASGWNPSPNSAVDALATWQDRLYVGGPFTNIGGVNRMSLGEFDLTSGALTSWDPGLNRGLVQTLLVNNNLLYAGGLILSSSGIPRRGMVTFDLTTGSLSPWDPGITGGIQVSSIATDGARLFVGGRFTGVGGLNRSNYFGVDIASGQLLPACDTSDVVYGVAATSNLVVLAGNFQFVAGQQRSQLAALNPDTGQPTSWNPNPDLYAKTVAIQGNNVYVGGAFLTLAGRTSRGIAVFPISLSSPPSILRDSFLRLADGSVEFLINAPGTSQLTVQASTNMMQWDILQTVPISNNAGSFTDTGAAQYPQRFYRLTVP